MTMLMFVGLVTGSVTSLLFAFRPRRRSSSMALNPSRVSKRQFVRLRDLHKDMSRSEKLQQHLDTLGMDWGDLETMRWQRGLMFGGMGAVLGLVLLVAGVTGAWLIALLGVLMATLGWWIPSMTVPDDAVKESDAFGYSFGGWLTLISMLVAGGVDINQAIRKAAEMGGGRHYETIRNKIKDTEIQGLSIWHVFRLLYAKHPIRQVEEVMIAVKLASVRGSSISDCILSQSDSLRLEQRLKKKQYAEKSTSKMQFPELIVVFITMGITLFGIIRSVSMSGI